MKHLDRYQEHCPRMPSTLGRVVAEAPEPPEALRRKAAEMWRAGRGAMFFPEQLTAMNPQERAAIEAAAERLYGRRRNHG